jgi:hypothetical protein
MAKFAVFKDRSDPSARTAIDADTERVFFPQDLRLSQMK